MDEKKHDLFNYPAIDQILMKLRILMQCLSAPGLINTNYLLEIIKIDYCYIRINGSQAVDIVGLSLRNDFLI